MLFDCLVGCLHEYHKLYLKTTFYKQEELFKSVVCGGSVASNEDNAIELTLYRKNGVRPNSQRPNPDSGVQVELGDGPPGTREVIFYPTLANLAMKYN